jgi:hypothetical protein
MADDDLSQREKRLQRHKAEARKDLPKTVAKTYGIWFIVLLVVGVAGYGIYKAASSSQACPDPHWHATFKVFVPGTGGQPELVDLATPRHTNGLHYYDLSGGAGMGYSIHMHQSGSETGSDALGPTQWHFEEGGVCVGVQKALHAVEIDATATSLKLFGAHAQVHQDKTYEANATSPLRWFIESNAAGNWTWSEKGFDQVKSYQLKDGESLLVTLGNYSQDQVRQMEAGIPAPISRTA